MAGLQLDLGKYNDMLSTCEMQITNSRSLIVDYTNQIAQNETAKAMASDDIDKYTSEVEHLQTVQRDYPPKIESLRFQLADYDYLISENFKPISDEEWKFVEDNNIDLSEKMENGEPRYIIAPGINDKQYHIYDMSKDGASIVRQMGENGGFDVIQNGNGYMRNYVNKHSEHAKIVFTLDDCDNLSYNNACYSTSSPLAFDLNGDGVKTS